MRVTLVSRVNGPLPWELNHQSSPLPQLDHYWIASLSFDDFLLAMTPELHFVRLGKMYNPLGPPVSGGSLGWVPDLPI